MGAAPISSDDVSLSKGYSRGYYIVTRVQVGFYEAVAAGSRHFGRTRPVDMIYKNFKSLFYPVKEEQIASRRRVGIPTCVRT